MAITIAFPHSTCWQFTNFNRHIHFLCVPLIFYMYVQTAYEIFPPLALHLMNNVLVYEIKMLQTSIEITITTVLVLASLHFRERKETKPFFWCNKLFISVSYCGYYDDSHPFMLRQACSVNSIWTHLLSSKWF